MRLYFVRHGESEANLLHVISNRQAPHALTERGKEQAEALAQNLMYIPFNRIFCSPVPRARETAAILSEALGVLPQVTDALREYDCGILEGMADDESWKWHRYYFNEWMLCRKYESKPEGGESFLEIRDRFIPFTESLKECQDENILLVGHGGTYLLMLPQILTNISNEFAREQGIGYTASIVAELHAGQWICKQWGDVQP